MIFMGTATVYLADESLTDTNFTDDQLNTLDLLGPQKDKYVRDLSLSVGGPIIKNKLWFFTSGRSYNWARAQSGFPKDVTHDEKFVFGKLTWQATKNIKLMAFMNYVKIHRPYYLPYGSWKFKTEEALTQWDEPGYVYNAQFNWILSQNAFLDFRFMRVDRQFGEMQRPDATHTNIDNGTGITSGAWTQTAVRHRGRYQYTPSMSFFLDNVLGGNHEVKIGGEYDYAPITVDRYCKEPIITSTWFGSPYTQGGNVGSFTAIPYTDVEGDGDSKQLIIKTSAYIHDNMTIADRVTLNIGVRYTSGHGHLPAQYGEECDYWMWLDPVWFARTEFPEYRDVLVFNTLSPRFGVVFDVFGDGKTVARASASRYYDTARGVWYTWASPNGFSRAWYRWIDDNWNGLIDTSDTFELSNRDGRQTDTDPYDRYDPDLTAPYTNELILAVDHELIPDLRVGVNFVYKENKDIFAAWEQDAETNWANKFYFTDPGYDGEFGTDDDIEQWAWDLILPDWQLGWRPSNFTNPPGQFRKYQGIEFIFEKRMSNRWQLFGSVVFSKMWGTRDAGYGSAQGWERERPNDLINRGTARLDFDRPLVVKMQATYMMPGGVNLSAYYRFFSGTPYARSISSWAQNAGYVRIQAEPSGTRRQQSFDQFDLRLEKSFNFGSFSRLGLYIDIFNALNSGYIYFDATYHGHINELGEFSKSSGWQRAYGVSEPRRIKFGLRFSF